MLTPVVMETSSPAEVCEQGQCLVCDTRTGKGKSMYLGCLYVCIYVTLCSTNYSCTVSSLRIHPLFVKNKERSIPVYSNRDEFPFSLISIITESEIRHGLEEF